MSTKDRTAAIPRLLLVDDEKFVIDSLKNFLRLETDYRVTTCESPVEALEILKEERIDMVISDFMMPEMDGLKFLSGVKEMYPDCIRILLTGYADKQNAIKAINDVGLYQYVEKPWDNDQLLMIIENGLAQQNLRATLKTKINELDKVLLQRDSLAQSKEIFEQELALARQLQESILPSNYPGDCEFTFDARYQPAIEIGGDFYDVMPLTDHKLAILVADLTGHGIQAALSTTLLKFSFTAFKNQDVSPGEIISGMNKTLQEMLPSQVFVTAVLVILDIQTGECSLVSGGGPHPYILRKSSGTVEEIFADGMLMGFVGDNLYKQGDEKSFTLEKGDRLLLFSDGITEILNEKEEHYEDISLKPTIAENGEKGSGDLMDVVINVGKEFARENHQWDDITILVIEKE